jgi:shikimate dehydrogenase
MKKAFVTGWPINHSKSPMLHGFWLKQYGIEGSYEAYGVEPENFVQFLKELPKSEFVGGNITIPHKEFAFAKVDQLDEAAKAIGAVNTLWFEDEKLCGGNTDAYGFSANMDQFASEWRDGKKAIVMGAGGAARAVIYAILEAGFEEVHIVNRTLERAQNLANLFGENCKSHPWDDLKGLLFQTDFIVNTTSIGMAGSDASMMPDLSTLPTSAIVTDIVYNPLETPFLKSANALGLKTVDGLGMLLHQAVPGFEKWFGLRPEVTDQLRDYILGLSS